jgi:hypothetical protein
MTKHRIITTLAVTTAAVAAGVPASFGSQPTLDAAMRLEARANADTSAAHKAVHTSGARARRLMARGARELARAAAIVNRADAQAEASSDSDADDAVVSAQLSLSAAAADQSATLAAIADEAKGKVEAAAKRALSKAQAIKVAADTALDDSGDEADGVSVEVSADAGADGDEAAAGSVELLALLSGSGR